MLELRIIMGVLIRFKGVDRLAPPGTRTRKGSRNPLIYATHVLLEKRLRDSAGGLPLSQATHVLADDLPKQHGLGRWLRKAVEQIDRFRLFGRFADVNCVDENTRVNGVHATRPG